MVWTPPVFLVVFCPLLIYGLIRSKQRIEWNLYNKCRQILSLLLIIVAVCECITVLVMYYKRGDTEDGASLPDICAAFVRLISSVRNNTKNSEEK